MDKVERFLKDDQANVKVVLVTNYSMEEFVEVMNNAYTEEDFKNGKDMVILHENYSGMDFPSLKSAKKTLERLLGSSYNSSYQKGVRDSIKVLSEHIENYSMENIHAE